MNTATHLHMFFADAGVSSTGNTAATDFWNTSLGQVLGAFLGVLGVLVVIFAVVRVIQHVAKGDIAKAVKGVLGSVLLAAFLFNPTLVQQSIQAGSTIVSKVVNTVSDIAGGSSSNNTTPTSPTNVVTGG